MNEGEKLVEAVAGLDAAASVFISLAGGVDTPLSDFFTKAAWDLYSDAFGAPPPR